MPIIKKTLKAKDGASRKAKIAYLVRVEGPRDPATGQRRRFSKQVATMAEAHALERSWQTDIARGTALDPSKTTVAELLDAWLTTKADSVTANALADYEVAIRRYIRPGLGPFWAQKLTPAHVQAQYGAWRTDGMSARMVHRCHLVLHQALAQAVRLGIVSRNVSSDVELPRMERPQMHVWTPEQVSAFLDEAKRDK